METTNIREKHADIQQKAAAIMEQNEHARELITGFVLAYETLHAAQADKESEER